MRGFFSALEGQTDDVDLFVAFLDFVLRFVVEWIFVAF
jgi:hypothetical protein